MVVEEANILEQKLLSGELVLQKADLPKMAALTLTFGGIPMQGKSEEELRQEFEDQTNAIAEYAEEDQYLKYMLAEYWTGKGNDTAGWAGWVGDLLNPCANVKDLKDIGKAAASAAKAAYDAEVQANKDFNDMAKSANDSLRNIQDNPNAKGGTGSVNKALDDLYR